MFDYLFVIFSSLIMYRKYLERIILSSPGYAQIKVYIYISTEILSCSFRNPLWWLGFIITQIVKLVPGPLLATSLPLESSEIR